MKTIGMIGGMSWHSTLAYYRIINETVNARLGGFASARCLLYSVEFGEIDALERQGRWNETAQITIQAAQSVERGGADFVIICTNTSHRIADQVAASIQIPLLHIADATARAIQACGLHKVGLLGTKFTMEGDFISGRIAQNFGIEVVTPDAPDRTEIDRVIYDELCAGQFLAASRARYVEVIEQLVSAGAEGIILGCTEIGLLIRPEDSPVPVFDTARIHAEAAADYALA